MATKFTTFFLSAVVVVTLLQSSMAQTTHVVGDSLGWVIPPNGASSYSNWAANKAFNLGDTLVFNFPTGSHDVAQVTKTSFDACTTTNPILIRTNGPANITLNTAGGHYYICRFPGHCSAGQKLFVNVSNTASSPAPQPSSPAPQPSSPSPVSAPTPTPSPSSVPTPTPASTPTTPTAPSPSGVTPPPSPATPTAPSPSGVTPPPSPATPTTPSPSGVTPPPPPNSSAKSLGIAGLFTTFFAIVVTLLY